LIKIIDHSTPRLTNIANEVGKVKEARMKKAAKQLSADYKKDENLIDFSKLI
jgi:hypothetical protein